MTRFRLLIRPVASLWRSVDFHVEALGFDLYVTGRDVEAAGELATAAFAGQGVGHALLGLGEQRLLLVEMPAGRLPATVDHGAGDPRFQHLAIITRDAAKALDRLLAIAPRTVIITRGGRPVTLPAASGGVTALKFRDPDGHPLELLSFAEHAVPRHWRDVAARSPNALTLGIDHSAIVVGDSARWIEFGTGVLGLDLASRQTNRGREQEQLDDHDEAVVEVVGLQAASPRATPHLELLGYARADADRRLSDDEGVRAVTVLQVDDLAAMRLRFERAGHAVVEPRFPHDATPHRRQGRMALATDPDERALLLWQPLA